MIRQIKTLVSLLAGLLISIPSFAQGPPLPPGHNARLVVVNVMLQGFYDPAQSTMRRAQYWDESSEQLQDRFVEPIAERITVQLRDKDDYSLVVTEDTGVNLLSDGKASFYISSEQYSDEYYITIITRNHLETTSAAPVNFAGADPVEYDFTTAASQAYGSNQAQLATGVFGLYAGDVNQDGQINISDAGPVNAGISFGETGYVAIEITGDGLVNISDAGPVNANIAAGVSKIVPE